MNSHRPVLSTLLFLLMAGVTLAQSQDAPPAPQEQTQGPPPGGGPGRGGAMMQGRGTIGKITAISGDTFTVSRQDGSTVTVKLNDKTEFRKDRQPAKLADFKVGDFVMVRGEENPDHSVTAQMVGSRSGNGGPGGGPGQGGGRGQFMGEMGKDFVAGEVKSIEAPKLTVLRTDNVTQTIELNEETSLRKGRESITMADIQPGDHVVLHGGLQNNVFVPKAVMVLSPEQWARMQQFAQGEGGPAGNAPAAAPSNNQPHQ